MKTLRCIGDSITEGWGLDDPAAQSWPSLLQDRFPKLDIRAFGSAGATVQSFLPAAYENTLAHQVAKRNPADLTLVFLGTNDAEQLTPHFAEEYEKLLSDFPGEKILIVPPKTGISALNRRLESIRQDILARPEEVIDLWDVPVSLSADGVHPDRTGQKQIAKAIADHLSKQLGQSAPDCL